MKYLTFISFLTFFCTAGGRGFAQSDENPWSIGINVSPAFSWRIASANQPLDYFKYAPSYGLNANVFLRRRLGKWGVSAGLGYNLFQYVETDDSLRLGGGVNPPQGYLNRNARYMLHYFSFPLQGEFYILDDNIRLYTWAAIEPSLNVAVRECIRYEALDGATPIDPDAEPFQTHTTDITHNLYARKRNFALFNLNAVVGVGLGVPLGERFMLAFEPYFRVQLLNTHETSTYYMYQNYSSRSYQIGVNCGVRYSFN